MARAVQPLTSVRIRQALVLAIMVTAIAGLPLRVAGAPACHECCPDMAPCCQMAPASPSTPARTLETHQLRAPATVGHTQTAGAVVSTASRGYPRLSDRHALHRRIAVLRI
jgi:hypothetical protein